MRQLPKKHLFFFAGFLLLFGLMLACGGSSGSSQQSVIEGNISDQVALFRTKDRTTLAKFKHLFSLVREAQATVSGVLVRIQNTEIETISDETGFFRLEGDFAGDINLEFVLPEAGGVLTLALNVPAGTIVMLQDVRFTQDAVTAGQTIVMEQNSGQNDNSNVDDAANSNQEDAGNSNDSGAGANDNAANDNSDDAQNDNSDDGQNDNDDEQNDNDDDGQNDNDDDQNNNDDNGQNDNDDDDDGNDNDSDNSGGDNDNDDDDDGNDNDDDDDDNDNS